MNCSIDNCGRSGAVVDLGGGEWAVFCAEHKAFLHELAAKRNPLVAKALEMGARLVGVTPAPRQS